MKTSGILSGLEYVVLLIVIIILASCNKKEDEEISHRLTKIQTFKNNVLLIKDTIIYENNKIISQISSFPENDSIKHLYEYPDGNSIIEFINSKENNEYWYLMYKYEMKYSGNEMSQINYYYNQGTQFIKGNTIYFNYINDKLVESIITSANGEALIIDSLKYNQGLLVQQLEYFSNPHAIHYKAEVIYEGNRASFVYEYSANWQGAFYETYKHEFYYQGNLLARCDVYDLYSNWRLNEKLKYSYDSFGNLISVSRESYNDNGTMESSGEVEYTYERGKGNYQQIQLPMVGTGVFPSFFTPKPTK